MLELSAIHPVVLPIRFCTAVLHRHQPGVEPYLCRRIEPMLQRESPMLNSRGRGLVLAVEPKWSMQFRNAEQCEFKHNSAGKDLTDSLYS